MQLSELGIHANSIEEGRRQAEEIMKGLSGTVCIRKIYVVLIIIVGLPVCLIMLPMLHAYIGLIVLIALTAFAALNAREALSFNGATGEFVHRGFYGTERFTLSDITEIRTQKTEQYHRRIGRRHRYREIVPTTSDRIVFKANGRTYSYVFREYQYLYTEKIGYIYEDLDKLVRLLLLYEHYFLNPPPADPNAGYYQQRQYPQMPQSPSYPQYPQTPPDDSDDGEMPEL
ncbi:MAG: hypothetical protein MJ065_08410 [Oscillospiraceae bacterium]|nr:hypothetical protein [Oscillospiraceae bacterium]